MYIWIDMGAFSQPASSLQGCEEGDGRCQDLQLAVYLITAALGVWTSEVEMEVAGSDLLLKLNVPCLPHTRASHCKMKVVISPSAD